MSSSLLLDELQALDPLSTSSSPSLDMDEALQNLSSCCDSELCDRAHYFDHPDKLSIHSSLDYLDELLMEDEDEDEDACCARQDAEASYSAIVSSLYDIIGELDPTSCESSSSLTRTTYSLEVSSNSLLTCEDIDPSLQQENVETQRVNQEIVQNTFYQTLNRDPRPSARGIRDLSARSGWNAQNWEQTSSVDHLKSTMNPSNMEISTFDEYKVKTAYADLYVAKRSLPDASTSAGTAQCLKEDKKKASRGVQSGSQSVRNANAEAEAFVDFRELLMNCAQFVAMGDLKKAREIVQKLYHIHGVSAKGNGLQRTAHFFCEALLSRMGGHRDETLGENTLSVASFIRSGRIWYEVAPYSKVMHYFVNQTILKAAKGASRLHVLNYGMFFGMQWPCLINALADREGGLPLLVITGIDCSKPGLNSLEWLEEGGRRLAAYAKTYNVPFQFHGVMSDPWEDVDPASLHLQESEVLVINCMLCLHHHPDESVDPKCTISPRQKLLMSMRNLNPHLLLLAEINSAGNSPLFVSRFREALYLYLNVMDMIDTLLSDSPDREFLEMMCHSVHIKKLWHLRGLNEWIGLRCTSNGMCASKEQDLNCCVFPQMFYPDQNSL
ncbi:hypothetical protein L7F22_047022 [Adiantum nelumboides]|nr:hypothetical protein [Adiantum nelumboides]